jgi:hypothetical protein
MLRAQSSWGNFEGVVTDHTGAVIPGAAVNVTNRDTNVARLATTNAAGYYEVRSLNPGVYSISAQVVGFKMQLVENLTLEVNQTIRQDFTMQVGAVTERVEVSASAAKLQTADATVGTVITHGDVVDLPLNGRSFLQLISLSPGTFSQTHDQSIGYRVGTMALNSPAINGTRGQDNNYTIDGVENNELSWNFYAMTPSVDAIQEFKVQSGTTSADVGRAAGANINMVIKSGTNHFHGDVYEFLRNDVLDANNFFANRAGLSRGQYKWNQFGATLGGPIKKDKTFFFGGGHLTPVVKETKGNVHKNYREG